MDNIWIFVIIILFSIGSSIFKKIANSNKESGKSVFDKFLTDIKKNIKQSYEQPAQQKRKYKNVYRDAQTPPDFEKPKNKIQEQKVEHFSEDNINNTKSTVTIFTADKNSREIDDTVKPKSEYSHTKFNSSNKKQDLQNKIVWAEILDKPVGLREKHLFS